MKFNRTLFAAVALSAFATPALAQGTGQPAATPPVAPSTTPPAEQPMASPVNPAAPAPAQPGTAPMTAQQPTAQTAPAAPAQATATAQTAAPVRAAAADLVVGAAVVDQQGQAVGTIETADATGAVVSTGEARARLNLDAFYKGSGNLVIGYTRAQFESAVTGRGGPETPDAEETPAATTAPAEPAPAATTAPETATPPATQSPE